MDGVPGCGCGELREGAVEPYAGIIGEWQRGRGGFGPAAAVVGNRAGGRSGHDSPAPRFHGAAD